MQCHHPPFPALLLLLAFSLASAGPLPADQIEMQNGDRYAGLVSSMTADAVVLQSDLLGKITLPRNKVASITLGSPPAKKNLPPAAPATNPAPSTAPAPLQTAPDISAALRQIGADTNLIQQVRQHFLADAGPTANSKFDDLLSGLLNGKTDLNSLRAEAKSAADQIRALKQDLGGDAGATLDVYLKILDGFLAESAAPAAPATNSPPAPKITR